MYIAKIPGTKYVCALESDHGEWKLRLKLGDVVETEELVESFTKRGIHQQIGDLFAEVNLNVNKFQHDLIHKEIIEQISHMLMQEQQKKQAQEHDVDAPEVNKEDPRVDDLMVKLKSLEKTLQILKDRVDRMESLSS